jgi:hypothetical protein
MLLLALALALIKPLPDATSPADGQLATQCVQYFRLQPTQIPISSEQCDREGYGMDFLRLRWKEIDALEQAHRDHLKVSMAKAQKRKEALLRHAELEMPCEQLALETGPGPDGGQELCDLADWQRAPIILRHEHDEREARLALQRRQARVRMVMGALTALVAMAGLALLRSRRRARSHG